MRLKTLSIFNFFNHFSFLYGIMDIMNRNSEGNHYFEAKSLIWQQIFFENLIMSIEIEVDIKFII